LTIKSAGIVSGPVMVLLCKVDNAERISSGKKGQFDRRSKADYEGYMVGTDLEYKNRRMI